ncbi:WhiB family transcriptional regulator [Rhodococcus sp. JS3073]|uniref:WhiB family transcriptional regulator n=1 Tax=Rhodococcus sp. JS3073 TaxID=3002901 RepID=UPI0022866A28|nr:WhiB family transcriptional regulator [Rhodococcus sp. JS3073]WAM19416.1 WhiB family transcriptional regulator [Rhodococcus sp. JS3073]
MDSEVFFPRDGEDRGARIRRERVAKEICGRCPVRQECRGYALASGEAWGIRGGTNEIDRRHLNPTPTHHTPAPPPALRISARHRPPGRRNVS